MNLRAMYTESERELSKFAVSAPSPAASVYFFKKDDISGCMKVNQVTCARVTTRLDTRIDVEVSVRDPYRLRGRGSDIRDLSRSDAFRAEEKCIFCEFCKNRIRAQTPSGLRKNTQTSIKSRIRSQKP